MLNTLRIRAHKIVLDLKGRLFPGKKKPSFVNPYTTDLTGQKRNGAVLPFGRKLGVMQKQPEKKTRHWFVVNCEAVVRDDLRFLFYRFTKEGRAERAREQEAERLQQERYQEFVELATGKK